MLFSFFFFFNDTATTEIYTLSLHDALPICFDFAILRSAMAAPVTAAFPERSDSTEPGGRRTIRARSRDRKSTRLNSSHQIISYAVFCLKKKKNKTQTPTTQAERRAITAHTY